MYEILGLKYVFSTTFQETVWSHINWHDKELNWIVLEFMISLVISRFLSWSQDFFRDFWDLFINLNSYSIRRLIRWCWICFEYSLIWRSYKLCESVNMYKEDRVDSVTSLLTVKPWVQRTSNQNALWNSLWKNYYAVRWVICECRSESSSEWYLI